MHPKANVIVVAAVAWLLGIWTASALRLFLSAWVVLALVGAGAAIGFRRHALLSAAGLATMVLALGAGRYALQNPGRDSNLVSRYNDIGPVTLTGVVEAEPVASKQTASLRVRAEELRTGSTSTEVRGGVLARLSLFPTYAYGDRLELTGELETPPELEDFSYRAYLEAQGVYSILDRPEVRIVAHDQGNPLYAALLTLRQRARDVVSGILPEPEASVLRGVLLGDETGIPDDLKEAFNTTGTRHLLVVSGSNIALLAAAFAWIGCRLAGRRRATPFVIAGIVAYTLLVGPSPAVIRAAIMGILCVVAVHFGRESDALIGLCVAAVLATLADPRILWNIGFQLSAAATLGLIVLVPSLQAGADRVLTARLSRERARPVLRILTDALLVTLAAQLMTWPIIRHNFEQQLSVVSLPANFLVLAAQPWIMGLGGIATLAAIVFEPAGRVLGWLAWLPLTYMVRVVQAMAGSPLAGVSTDFWLLSNPVAFYAALAAAVVLVRQPAGGLRALGQRATGWLSERTGGGRMLMLGTRPEQASGLWGLPRTAGWLALAGLAGMAVLSWAAVLSLPDGRLHVAFLDVGQGDAILVTTPSGKQVLIDGGPDPRPALSGVGQHMPFWDRELDLVVLSHPDDDHLLGLIGVLERYRVDRVMEATSNNAGLAVGGGEEARSSYERWRQLVEERGVPVVAGQAGTRLLLGDGVWADVLNPAGAMPAGTPDNDASVVLRLGYGDVTFLLTGDLGEAGEAELVRSSAELRSTVLKVGHHGSKEGTTAQFVAAVAPAVAVIPVGADNRFGHPAQEVLDRLAGQAVYRTDEDGTVEVVSDGRRMWVRTER